MRTSPDEAAALGRLVAGKLNASRGPVSVLRPRRGFSANSAPDGVFHDPAADAALCDALESGLRPDVAVTSLDCGINDAAVARAAGDALLALMARVSEASQPARLS